MTSELVKNYGRDVFKDEKMLKGNKQKYKITKLKYWFVRLFC
jgi:hypothetical protein